VRLPLVLALALALAACDGGSPGGSRPPGEATPSGSPGGNAAVCSPAKPHALGDSDQTIVSGGEERSYILHLPPFYDGTPRLPLVLNLHGYASAAAQQASYSGWSAKGDAEGFIVVTPNALGTPQRWDTAPAGVDVAFFNDLLDRLEADLCVDGRRIYASGISNGAAMSARLACSLSGRIAAIAPVAALIYPLQCERAPNVPVIAFHGTDDMLVPFEGGTTQPFGLPVKPVEEYASGWAVHDGCAGEPARERASEHVRIVAYSECDDDVAVILYVVEGGGHTWPGATDVPRLGATTREVSATDEAWRFFEAQAEQRR